MLTNLRFLLLLKCNAGAHFKKSKGARIRSRFRSINAHDEQKRQAQMNWILCEDPGNPLWCLQPMGKCIETRKHKYTFTNWIHSRLCNYSKKRLLFYRLEDSAKTTDILISGVSGQKPRLAKGGKTIVCKTDFLSFQGCRICRQQVQLKSEVTDWPQEIGADHLEDADDRLRDLPEWLEEFTDNL